MPLSTTTSVPHHGPSRAQDNPAERPTGRAPMVVALCGASIRRWATTVRRIPSGCPCVSRHDSWEVISRRRGAVRFAPTSSGCPQARSERRTTNPITPETTCPVVTLDGSGGWRNGDEGFRTEDCGMDRPDTSIRIFVSRRSRVTLRSFGETTVSRAGRSGPTLVLRLS